jgi:hypothetical protein
MFKPHKCLYQALEFKKENGGYYLESMSIIARYGRRLMSVAEGLGGQSRVKLGWDGGWKQSIVKIL